MEGKQQNEVVMPEIGHQQHTVVVTTPTPTGQPMATAQLPSAPAPVSTPKTNKYINVQPDVDDDWIEDGREETEVDYWAESDDLPTEDEDTRTVDNDIPPSLRESEDENPPVRVPGLGAFHRHRGKRLVHPEEKKAKETITPEQRLLLLDTWQRSGLPAGDFAPLVGVSPCTIHAWKKRFEDFGPAGLVDKAMGVQKGSRLSEITKRTILMMKKQHPEWGCERISNMLLRGPALPASPTAVAKYLHESGYETVDVPTHPHPDKIRFFERAKPNQLWQTDLFTFMLKRQNRRVHLVAFMDDHSRFIVAYGLHATASGAMVLETLRSGIASYQTPEEVLTDNGSQYVTWRGKSAFTRECERLGIKQIVAKPRHPRTLGKVERFWGTLWRECVESSIFIDLGDARTRIGHFIDYYNFQRPHMGLKGLVPADRYFKAAQEVLKTLKERVSANALQIARDGVSKQPFYITGHVDGKAFSVHSEGERMILTPEGGERREIDLIKPDVKAQVASEPALPAPVCPQGIVPPNGAEMGSEEPAPVGTSPLDGMMREQMKKENGNGE
jgi:transposase InsO family protein